MTVPEAIVVELPVGTAAELHARPVPDPATPALWFLDVTAPSIVLGSTQPWEDVDHVAAADAGIEVARRRSGGGAVLLAPGAQVWLDVVLPRNHPRWDERVDVAAAWVGEVWAGVLRDLVCPPTGGTDPGPVSSRERLDVSVHHGANAPGPLGAVACFAGLGPGEVTLSQRKVVGVSQRRTSGWARFQTTAYLATGSPARATRPFDPERLARIVAPAARRVGQPPSRLVDGLHPVPVPDRVDARALIEALTAAFGTVMESASFDAMAPIGAPAVDHP